MVFLLGVGIDMKYEIGSYYKYRNLIFRVVDISPIKIHIVFTGNMLPDRAGWFELGSEFDKAVVPATSDCLIKKRSHKGH